MTWFGEGRPRDAEGRRDRREQIVAAALERLARTPLERLTTREIARAVGVSQPALFRHFRSREAILLAVAEAARGALEGEVAAIVGEGPGGPGPVARCAALARALARHVERHPGLPRLLFADLALEAPSLRTAVGHLVDMQRTLVAELLRQARDRGELQDGVDPAAGAELFVGMMQGMALRHGEPGEVAPLGARLEPVLALWCRAVGGAAGAAGAAAADLPAVASAPFAAAAAAADLPGPAARLVFLDVRPTLGRGRDPLADILAELDGLAGGSALVITAPFRPRPLEALLTARGHAVEVHPGPGGAHSLVCVVGGAPAVVDLRELEAPLPMERVLELSEGLPPGGVLLAHVPRFPAWLLPHLHGRGLRHELALLCDDSALLRVVAQGGPAGAPAPAAEGVR